MPNPEFNKPTEASQAPSHEISGGETGMEIDGSGEVPGDLEFMKHLGKGALEDVARGLPTLADWGNMIVHPVKYYREEKFVRSSQAREALSPAKAEAMAYAEARYHKHKTEKTETAQFDLTPLADLAVHIVLGGAPGFSSSKHRQQNSLPESEAEKRFHAARKAGIKFDQQQAEEYLKSKERE